MPTTMGGGYGGRGGLRLGLGLGTGLIQTQGGGSNAPVLGNITASPNTATVDSPYTGTTSGRTAGSTLSLTGTGAAGLSINNTTGAITGTPTASGPVNVVETLAGATGSPKTSAGVITVSFDANILFLDRYATNPNSGLLSARVPLVTGDAAFPNHYPSSDGNIAPLMRVASGVMGQSATGTGAGYDNVLLTENPGMVSCDFIWGNGAQPAVMGIYPYPGTLAPTPNPAALKLIHLFTTTTSLAPQLGKSDYFPTGAANYPFALPSPASPFTLTVGQKYTLRAKFQSGWVFMELLDSGGSVIAKAQAFDSLVPQLMGRGAFLAETFDTAMTYSEAKAMRISPFTVPTINPAINSYFPTGLDGLVGSMYAGGGVAWTSANRVTITANATLGSGAAIPIGPIAVNDRVRVTVDVVSVGANGFVVAIAPTSPAAPISAITPFFSAPGRATVELVATGANSDSSLVIGGNGVGATTAVIQSDFTLVNPPALI